MEVSGHIHSQAALPLEEEDFVPICQEAVIGHGVIRFVLLHFAEKNIYSPKIN